MVGKLIVRCRDPQFTPHAHHRASEHVHFRVPPCIQILQRGIARPIPHLTAESGHAAHAGRRLVPLPRRLHEHLAALRLRQPAPRRQLTEAGFTPHTTTLTPQQIAIIVRFWGTPALVYEMIKKNSYLAVPKMGKKI